MRKLLTSMISLGAAAAISISVPTVSSAAGVHPTAATTQTAVTASASQQQPQLVSTASRNGFTIKTYAVGNGSTVTVKTEDVPRSGAGAQGATPQISFGGDDDGSFIILSPADQDAFVAGGVAAAGGLLGLISGPLGVGAAVLGAIIAPYFNHHKPCGDNQSWKAWVEPSGDSYVVTKTACV